MERSYLKLHAYIIPLWLRIRHWVVALVADLNYEKKFIASCPGLSCNKNCQGKFPLPFNYRSGSTVAGIVPITSKYSSKKGHQTVFDQTFFATARFLVKIAFVFYCFVAFQPENVKILIFQLSKNKLSRTRKKELSLAFLILHKMK